MGPEIKELEDRLTSYVGVKHVVTCSSGTDALLMPLMAYGVGPADDIFTMPFTFIATAEVIQLLGATPVFVDIDPKTFNIDPVALQQAIAGLSRNPKTASLTGGLRCHKRPGSSARPLCLGGCSPIFWGNL